MPRALGRMVVPHGLDERLDRDHPVGVEQQRGQHDLLPGALELDAVPLAPELERPKDAKLDFRHRTSTLRS
ncbi:hypothetical protein HerbRD11066_32650 [Herbidospora sp. RD11066]